MRELINEASIVAVGNDIESLCNKIVREMTGLNIAPYETKSSARMWTRGDGSKYKEPSRVRFPMREFKYLRDAHDIIGKYGKIENINKAVFKELFGDSRFKFIGKVSGEFASSDYNDAYTFMGKLIVRNSNSILYSDKSVLKNSDVWKLKK